jgi:hypothetical protein
LFTAPVEARELSTDTLQLDFVIGMDSMPNVDGVVTRANGEVVENVMSLGQVS